MADETMSLLDSLAARRQELLAEASTEDVPVPGWHSPSLFLRMRPLEHSVLRNQSRRIERAKGASAKANAELSSSAMVVRQATELVLIGDEGPAQAELDFDDERLLASLGLPADATDLTILRALALGKDGVILKLSERVYTLSGYANLDADEDFAGE